MYPLLIASILILFPGCVISRDCTDIFDCSSPSGFCCDNGQCCSFDEVSEQNHSRFISIAVGISVSFIFLICCCTGICMYIRHRSLRNAQHSIPTYHVSHTATQPSATGTQYPTTVIAPSTYNTPGQGYPQQPQYPPSGYQSTQNMTSSPPPYATAEIISASSAPSAPPSYEQSVTYPTTHIGSNTKSY